MRKRNVRISRLTGLVLLWLVLLRGAGFASGGDDFSERMSGILERERIVTLPLQLNGIPLENLRNVGRMDRILLHARRKRGAFAGTLVFYRHISEKLAVLKKFSGDPYQETSLDRVFSGGFTQLGPGVFLLHPGLYLTSAEEREARLVLGDLMKSTDLESYEKKLVESRSLRPDRVLAFYERIAGRLKPDLETLATELIDNSELARKELQLFTQANINLEVSIGSSVLTPGTRLNLKQSSPVDISLRSLSEGVTRDIPMEWTLRGPGSFFRSGALPLGGERTSLEVLLYQSEGSLSEGLYELSILLFPGTDHEIARREMFSIGDVPYTIARAFILDEGRKVRSHFSREESVLLAVQYYPTAAASETANFSWLVFDEAGNKVSALSINKPLKIRTTDNPLQTKYIKGVIPKDFPGGTYRFKMIITSGNYSESSDPVIFTVK